MRLAEVVARLRPAVAVATVLGGLCWGWPPLVDLLTGDVGAWTDLAQYDGGVESSVEHLWAVGRGDALSDYMRRSGLEVKAGPHRGAGRASVAAATLTTQQEASAQGKSEAEIILATGEATAADLPEADAARRILPDYVTPSNRGGLVVATSADGKARDRRDSFVDSPFRPTVASFRQTVAADTARPAKALAVGTPRRYPRDSTRALAEGRAAPSAWRSEPDHRACNGRSANV